MGKFKNIIAAWSGILGNIPGNWRLCDGTNGTPDLEQLFVRGSQGAYAIGDTGGAVSHDHDFTTAGHQHDLASGNDLAYTGGYDDDTSIDTDTGTTAKNASPLPWYSLAFIMRMS